MQEILNKEQPGDSPAGLSLLRTHALDEPEPIDDSPEITQDTWMVSYLDLVTLLLSLFIVMGTLNAPKAGIQVQETSNGMNAKNQETPVSMDATIKRQGQKQGLEEELNRIIGSNSLGGVMDVKVSPGQIRLQMHASMLFGAGEANLNDSAGTPLKDLARLLQGYPGRVEVAGHSDNIPVSGGRYRSNWELSSARAASVVESLIEIGIPASRLHATGYADTRPITTNATPEGRAKNRRVEFIVEMGPELIHKR
ncbi:chemotaxis protein MotB [Mariprofundus ferrinatatus]|uniref:Chemotaxis protein MotB n=1 Tax=Mariprofundus ferrinatatus TaxID=1921087 RepID=A0A2K8L9K2_9PROT|nr:OmpA family protein [Mariprofundus ferrinatatus]ATX82929.1 chemotaxis protein MotB [Mariprofundus ferrinatatus]